MNDLASFGRTEDASFSKSLILPSLRVSIKSIPYSRFVRRSSSPRNAPRLIRYSCQRFALLSTLTPSSNSDRIVSAPLPSVSKLPLAYSSAALRAARLSNLVLFFLASSLASFMYSSICFCLGTPLPVFACSSLS